MTHSKKELQKLSKAQLVMTLLFILTLMKTKTPGLYALAEKKAGLRKSKRSAAKSKPRKKRGTAKQVAARKKNAAKFKAFVKKHGRGPRKGEHL
jgi:hypothetical protein